MPTEFHFFMSGDDGDQGIKIHPRSAREATKIQQIVKEALERHDIPMTVLPPADRVVILDPNSVVCERDGSVTARGNLRGRKHLTQLWRDVVRLDLEPSEGRGIPELVTVEGTAQHVGDGFVDVGPGLYYILTEQNNAVCVRLVDFRIKGNLPRKTRDTRYVFFEEIEAGLRRLDERAHDQVCDFIQRCQARRAAA